MYYKSPELAGAADGDDRGCLSLVHVAAVTHCTDKKEGARFDVAMTDDERIYSFQADTSDEAARWVEAILDAQRASLKHKSNMAAAENNTIRVSVVAACASASQDATLFHPQFIVSLRTVRNALPDNGPLTDAVAQLEVLDGPSHESAVIVKRRTAKCAGRHAAPDFDYYIGLHQDMLIQHRDWTTLSLRISVLDNASHTFVGGVLLPLSEMVVGAPPTAVSHSLTQFPAAVVAHYTHYKPCKHPIAGSIDVSVKLETIEFLKSTAHFSFGRAFTSLPSTLHAAYAAPIPRVLTLMQNYLFAPERDSDGGTAAVVEGIFRLAPQGSTVAAARAALNHNMEALDPSSPASSSLPLGVDAIVVAHLLKVWLRDLPERILTCVPVVAFGNVRDEATAAALVEEHLPEPQRSVFEWYLDLCLRVAASESTNRMGYNNLAIVFSPNLLVYDDDPLKQVELQNRTTNFFTLMLRHRHVACGAAKKLDT